MGAGAIRGQETQCEDRDPQGQGSGCDGHPAHISVICRVASPVMECEGCSIKFSLLKRKKQCGDCGRQFCSSCSVKVNRALRRCSKCEVILAGDFTKQDLLTLRVKDLRFFLKKKNIPTRTCTEKGHLVDLIFHNFASATHQSLEREHEQHVGRLAERMREAIDEERQSREERQRQQGESTPSEEHSPPADESEEERATRLRQRQDREMRETLHRLAEELQQNENNRDERPANVRAKLSDIEREEDIESLTVKQLKELLATNFVDYKGCCEKYELAERVQRLWREYHSDLKRAEEIKLAEDVQETTVDAGEEELCKICMDAAIECVLLECGHMVTCTKCGRRLAECPICRQNVVRVEFVFSVPDDNTDLCPYTCISTILSSMFSSQYIVNSSSYIRGRISYKDNDTIT
ncbi:E3 ubiquitin-protein ligase RNF34-like [Liolophura sinensis]|uniref:E3 ubiquitin-protein ligase RNF34-like n=1 Tax=Liolophura sinensis TaxID=3198878 RepID=UPI0031585EF0